MPANFERMMELVGEVFAAHNDPDQLDVDEKIIERLQRLHPAAVTEQADKNGPIVWLIIMPTTEALMKKFVAGEISENELLNNTPLNIKYDALYLCSVLVLPEYRRKGLARELALKGIDEIRKDHPIHTLFTWNFSKEGALLAESIARHESLPLLQRERKIK